MSVNRHKEHILVLPEDDANRQMANGLVLEMPDRWPNGSSSSASGPGRRISCEPGSDPMSRSARRCGGTAERSLKAYGITIS